VRSPSGLHDNPLIGGTKWLGKTGQRGLDEPRFEDHSCSLAIGIEFPGHSQRFERGCDAPGRHTCQDDLADPRLCCDLPFVGLLDHSQRFTGCGTVAFKSALCELEQEGLGRRNGTLGSTLADFQHLGQNGLIGRLAMTPPRTTGRIAALALCKAACSRRLAIPHAAIIFGILRRTIPDVIRRSPVASADCPSRGCSVVLCYARPRSGDYRRACGGGPTELPKAQVGAAPVRPPTLREQFTSTARRGHWLVLAGAAEQRYTHVLLALLEFRMPKLLWGEDDPFQTVDYAERYAREIPETMPVRIKSAGNIDNDPPAVAGALAECFAAER
jgi:hypothetical protein